MNNYATSLECQKRFARYTPGPLDYSSGGVFISLDVGGWVGTESSSYKKPQKQLVLADVS